MGASFEVVVTGGVGGSFARASLFREIVAIQTCWRNKDVSIPSEIYF